MHPAILEGIKRVTTASLDAPPRAPLKSACAVVAAFALLSPAAARTPVVLAATAQTCNVLVGSDWAGPIGTSGVPVCSTFGATPDGTISVVPVGDPWQCVELAQRFWQNQGWFNGYFPSGSGYVQYAFQIYPAAASGQMGPSVIAYPNGSGYVPVPGDLIVVGAPDGSQGPGHVAIVDQVVGQSVIVYEQNASSTGIASYTLGANDALSRTGDTRTVEGVVHSTYDTFDTTDRELDSLPTVTYVAHLYENLWHQSDQTSAATQAQSEVLGLQTGSLTSSQLASQLVDSPTFIDDQIESYYQSYLQRTPSAAEVSSWAAAVENGSLTLGEAKIGFLASDEYYADAGGTPSGFVTALYKSVLGRTPSAQEAASWVAALDAAPPLTRTHVAAGFVTSLEGLDDEVISWYQTYLGRMPAAQEIATWEPALAGANGNYLPFIAFFASSPEYQSIAENGYVPYLYQQILHRAPDPGGEAAFDAALSSNGLTPSAAASIMLLSQEYDTDIATAYWTMAFGTAPTAADIAPYVNDLETGSAQPTDIEADILATQAFFTKSGGTDAAYVTALYQDVLHRTPQASEVAGWVQTIEDGQPLITVAEGFTSSTEGLTDVVNGWYASGTGISAPSSSVSADVVNIQDGYVRETDIEAFVLGGYGGLTESQGLPA